MSDLYVGSIDHRQVEFLRADAADVAAWFCDASSVAQADFFAVIARISGAWSAARGNQWLFITHCTGFTDEARELLREWGEYAEEVQGE